MKLGLVTDCLENHSLDEVLGVANDLGIDCLEFTTGCWGSAPHLRLDVLLGERSARQSFLARIQDHGLSISALNCSGNPLHPGPSGAEHARTTLATVDLASHLNIHRVVMMSGCPGAPGDNHPNWITVAWPPEAQEILRWQWDEVLVPYWLELAAYARRKGVVLCLELHGHQNVYNVETFFRLRESVGDTIGVNLDPSHLHWMGADPIAAIEALGDCIYHVHAKDTRINSELRKRNGLIETIANEHADRRSWNYVTVGQGHDAEFWSSFRASLVRVGYDDVLSVEHEDVGLAPIEGVRRSIDFLREIR